MNSTGPMDWVPFYKQAAEKLLQYKQDRTTLVAQVKNIFKVANMNMPRLDRDYNFVDVDPFTVFALFNKTSPSDTSRVKIAAAVAQVFEISAPAPTSFDGIPSTDPRTAVYYPFAPDREEGDIDNLWELFESALQYADHPTAERRAAVSRSFDIVIRMRGNGNSKVTMGLFWIAPYTFLNLDRRSEWYIYRSEKIPQSVVQALPRVTEKISADTYFEIADKMQAYLKSGSSSLKNYRELCTEAWHCSQEVNEQNGTRRQRRRSAGERGNAAADNDVEVIHYWLYSPGENASCWDEFYDSGIMAIGWDNLGNLSGYDSMEELGLALRKGYGPGTAYKTSVYAMWQFVHEVKPRDVVFVKKGNGLILGRGIVQGNYEYDTSRRYFKNVRRIRWTNTGEWELPSKLSVHTLADITPYIGYIENLNALFDTDDGIDPEEEEARIPLYSEEEFLSEVYMDRNDYEMLTGLLERKMNVILEGAPGVGKTFAAKRLAYAMMGEKDPGRVMTVQFHQSYSYEDFIMGIRPSETGFELKKGVFYNFCKTAAIDRDNDYFFIIDEINRGNLSKIFGELFMLIEKDKRNIPLQLLYADETFSIPGNVYIIGTMNTADRSLAILDYALRRRFAFFEMKPAFDNDRFLEYEEGLHSEIADRLIDCVKELNREIESDESLGEGFCIGHSYFCGFTAEEMTDQLLRGIIEYELIPMLKEYWFDEPSKVRNWSSRLRSTIR